VKLPVLGVLENMSGFVCPHCGTQVDVFRRGGGEGMAKDMGVPFLGRIPLDPDMVTSGETGVPFMTAFPESETSRALTRAVGPLLERLGWGLGCAVG